MPRSDWEHRDRRSLDAAKKGLSVTLRLALLRRSDVTNHQALGGGEESAPRHRRYRSGAAVAVGVAVALHWDSLWAWGEQLLNLQ